MISKIFKTLFASSILSFSIYQANAQLNIQSNKTAFQLAQALTGQGVVVSNATLNCANNSNGVFQSPNAMLGLDSGIVLSTGNVSQMRGAEPGATSSNMNRNGDAQLTAISGTNVTYDACVLEFDVIPNGSELKFDYLFASEEYINAVCGPFNDVFAFFISGPGITGQKNIALVPNTQIPVAVNSVNDGIVGSYQGSNIIYCTGMGGGSPFTQYYINNANNSNFAYRGYTTVFTAKQTVTPCQTYHLKLAIADAGNKLYDSGVLIKAGSLTATNITSAIDAPLHYQDKDIAVKGCAPAHLTFSRNIATSIAQTVQLSYGGTAVAGVDYATLPSSITIAANSLSTSLNIIGLPTTDLNDKTLEVYIANPNNCNNPNEIVDTLYLTLIANPTVSIESDTINTCAGKPVQILTSSTSNLISYEWSPNRDINNIRVAQPIVSPTATTTYYLQSTILESGCIPTKDSVVIMVIQGAEQIVFSDDSLVVCKGNTASIEAKVEPFIADMNYTWMGPNNYTSNGNNLRVTNAQGVSNGWYIVTASSQDCGSLTDSVFINVISTVPLPEFTDPQRACVDMDYKVTAIGKDLKWYYPNGKEIEELPVIVNSPELGTFDYFVTQSYGECESEKAKITVQVMKCCEQEMFIPNAFTPNGDGVNDEFLIRIDNGTKVAIFEIYNRWGQRVYISSGINDIKWDGTLNGRALDMGVYYYNMDANCIDGRGVNRKGEIHLLK
jgi:gliding motility-associated-like protein